MDKRALLIEPFECAHRKFGFLQSIHLYRDEDEPSIFNLDIILGGLRLSGKKMLFNFSGVRDFKSENLLFLCCLLVKIRDVTSHQLEGIHYKVVEVEENLFSFYCDDFDFKVI